MGIAVPKPAPKGKKPRKRVKASNPKRRKSEFARCYHSRERVKWVKSQPCVVCSRVPSENAHVETGGIGRKAGYAMIVPLCFDHHAEYHHYGAKWFQYEFSFDALAAETERRWLARDK